jgi:hypothetical protein
MENEMQRQFDLLDNDVKSQLPISFRLIKKIDMEGRFLPQLIDGKFYRKQFMIAYKFEKPISKIIYPK